MILVRACCAGDACSLLMLALWDASFAAEGAIEKVASLARLSLGKASSSFTYKFTLAKLAIDLFYVLVIAKVLGDRFFFTQK